MNGICRNFPASIAELLKGTGTTADNRLCTTLFCVSSGIKKLAQTTSLPPSGCPAAPKQPPGPKGGRTGEGGGGG